MSGVAGLLAETGIIVTIFCLLALFAVVRSLRARTAADRATASLGAQWHASYDALRDANASAIAVLENPEYAGFPEDVRDELLAAHLKAASLTRGKRNAQ